MDGASGALVREIAVRRETLVLEMASRIKFQAKYHFYTSNFNEKKF